MRLGFNLLLVTDFVDESQLPFIERLAKTGYDGVEVPIFKGSIDHYRQLGRQLAEMGLGVTTSTAMFADHNPISHDAAVRSSAADVLKVAIDRSHALGSNMLIGPVHSAIGEFSGEAPSPTEFHRSVAVLQGVADHAKAGGVVIGVEYLNRFENYLLTTMADAVRYVDEIGHPSVGVMFDTFHAHIEEKESAGAIRLAGDRLVHFHASENDRGVPGTGQVRWQEVFRALKQVKYDGWVTIESFGRSLPAIAAATRVWRDLAISPEDVADRGQQFVRAAWAVAE